MTDSAQILPAHLVDGDGSVDHHPPDDLGFVGDLGLPLLGLGHHWRLRNLCGRWDAAALGHLREKERGEGHRRAHAGQPHAGAGHHHLCPPSINAAASL